MNFEPERPWICPAVSANSKKSLQPLFLAIGVWKDRKLGVPGEDLKGVEGCLDFLTRLYRGEIKEVRETVAVIGDGNAAFDLARALVRLGARVTVLSWFPETLIPADPEEIVAAREEGIIHPGQHKSRWLYRLGWKAWRTSLRSHPARSAGRRRHSLAGPGSGSGTL